MKRSGRLPRRVGLISTTGLSRSAPLRARARSAGHTDPGQTPPAPSRRSQGAGAPIPTAVRHAVREREGDRCARCGLVLRDGNRQTQHRVPRGAGGRSDAHRLSALILVCGFSATDPSGCHRWCESFVDDARRAGYRVPPGTDPALWPVHTWDGCFLFTDGGDRVPYASRSQYHAR